MGQKPEPSEDADSTALQELEDLGAMDRHKAKMAPWDEVFCFVVFVCLFVRLFVSLFICLFCFVFVCFVYFLCVCFVFLVRFVEHDPFAAVALVFCA